MWAQVDLVGDGHKSFTYREGTRNYQGTYRSVFDVNPTRTSPAEDVLLGYIDKTYGRDRE